MKKFKIVLLFLLILCAFDIAVIYLKNGYVIERQDELIEEAKEKLKEEVQDDNIHENIVFQDGVIGLIVIPSINLEAPIHEGTSAKVLRYSVRTF